MCILNTFAGSLLDVCWIVYTYTPLPTWRRPTSYRRCERRLTTTTAAASLFRASRCVRCRHCSWCPSGTCMNDRTRRGIGASLRWSVVTTRWCGAPSSHCTRMRPRRRRRCCRMHVASCRQNISRCPPGFCNVFCCIYCCMCDINTFGYLLKFDHYVSDEIQLKEMSDERQNRPILSADKIA